MLRLTSITGDGLNPGILNGTSVIKWVNSIFWAASWMLGSLRLKRVKAYRYLLSWMLPPLMSGFLWLYALKTKELHPSKSSWCMSITLYLSDRWLHQKDVTRWRVFLWGRLLTLGVLTSEFILGDLFYGTLTHREMDQHAVDEWEYLYTLKFQYTLWQWYTSRGQLYDSDCSESSLLFAYSVTNHQQCPIDISFAEPLT